MTSDSSRPEPDGDSRVSGFDDARRAVASLDLAAVGSSRWYAGKQPEAVELVDALLAPGPVLAVVDVLAGSVRSRHTVPLSERLWPELVRIVAEGRPVTGLAGSFVPRSTAGAGRADGRSPAAESRPDQHVGRAGRAARREALPDARAGPSPGSGSRCRSRARRGTRLPWRARLPRRRG